MRIVTHREMRNASGEILRAVAAGETVQVTNNGRVAAVISPPFGDALTHLDEQRQVRRAQRTAADLSQICRRKISSSTAELLADARGPW